MARNKKSQKDLPGMENRHLEPLHSKAIEYDAVKTQRMKLTKQESDLKEEIIGLMKKNEKIETGYHMDGVDIEFEPAEEPRPKIKVKVALDPEATEEVERVSPQDGADFETAVQ
jgi:hypothetical protein